MASLGKKIGHSCLTRFLTAIANAAVNWTAFTSHTPAVEYFQRWGTHDIARRCYAHSRISWFCCRHVFLYWQFHEHLRVNFQTVSSIHGHQQTYRPRAIRSTSTVRSWCAASRSRVFFSSVGSPSVKRNCRVSSSMASLLALSRSFRSVTIRRDSCLSFAIFLRRHRKRSETAIPAAIERRQKKIWLLDIAVSCSALNATDNRYDVGSLRFAPAAV